ncbi:uncharacterized protein BO95DRAFT_440843 [Aspergillus brunneoviolaceus CBS 621.78]|uniref:Uncharacterized protein n=1 Tax=Aspergillus brunneoviolaceus CBS 621.78 TaxID=1450534 RepID=A0ACD1GFW5_9EURO|nr:hypothetical protein BO95DRAFT_440843 [Aspergillus brunneoviolaceus CBS 621.78]RAH48146.1 hypothetical protein BO95DRAFT_440843 [Aspergillus brunneoviolaceus CBS 621.78]
MKTFSSDCRSLPLQAQPRNSCTRESILVIGTDSYGERQQSAANVAAICFAMLKY